MMPALDPADLKAVFGLMPDDAITYLKRKGYKIGWNWQETLDEAHARAFTVAKVAGTDVLQDIRKSLVTALEKGETLDAWRRGLTPTLQAKGWWGKQIHVDSQGNAQEVQLGSPRRLKTIYQTNLQSAYMAGRYKQMQEAAATHPLWRYVAVLDGRTRPSHRAMNGRVFRADDPVWNSIYPPNGFNCRCRVSPMTEDQAQAGDVTVESSAGRLNTTTQIMGKDRYGQDIVAERTGLAVQGADGRPYFFAPDAGFNGSPAASHLMDDLLYQKANALLPEQQAYEAIRDTLLSAPRMKVWRHVVNDTLDTARAQGKKIAISVMQPADLACAAERGIAPGSGLIYLEDSRLVGKKAQRHTIAGNQLTDNEWLTLPTLLANAPEVFWDTKNKTLLYVMPSDDGRLIKLALAFGRTEKAGSPRLDEAATVFKVTRQDLESGIKNGQYEKVR